VEELKFLGLAVGSWAEWVGALATFLATGLALYLSLKKPQLVKFSFETGDIFHWKEDYKRFSFDNLKHKFTDNQVTLNLLNINVLNVDLVHKVIFESGVIVRGDFRKQRFGYYLSKKLLPNQIQHVDFGNNRHGNGHIVTLRSYKLNPFITYRNVTFKVYVKDSSGKVYKSNYFKLNDF